ncbi:MAG: branched-chain amino acid ABC transporter permease [Anaerolineaceae bacterium]
MSDQNNSLPLSKLGAMLDRTQKGTNTRAFHGLNRQNALMTLAGAAILILLLFRIQNVIAEAGYSADTWVRFVFSGLIIGGMYALVAIGYTLVYGILSMINFAHGDVMMLGSFGGYFVLVACQNISVGMGTLLNTYPILSLLAAFLVGMGISALMGFLLEKIAYRPLRNASRLAPLISAIGASTFIEVATQLMFGVQRREYPNPDLLTRGAGWTVMVGGNPVVLTYTGVFSLALSFILMVALYLFVQHTRLGKAMRAVSQDRNTAALMGIDVNKTISQAFILSGVLAGAAGVMWGVHNGLINYYLGFLPGSKAFTAAVLGGIGNIPGAMLGGMFLGMIESVGPAALGIDFQLKDVLAFSILILVLIFRPSGLLGEALSKEKV